MLLFIYARHKIKLLCICLPLLTIFQLYRRVSFIGGGNCSTPRKPPACRKSLTNLSHNVVSSTLHLSDYPVVKMINLLKATNLQTLRYIPGTRLLQTNLSVLRRPLRDVLELYLQWECFSPTINRCTWLVPSMRMFFTGQ